jgi:hypothetical protein
MTMHTAGWLEMRVPDWDGPRPSDLTAPAPTWEAIVYLEPFITWEYEEARHRVGADQLAHRLHTGWPVDVSARVQTDYQADVQAWASVALPQWAEWGAIAHVDWQEAADSGWRLVLEMAKHLAQRYGAHNLRLVLWSKVVMG